MSSKSAEECSDIDTDETDIETLFMKSLKSFLKIKRAISKKTFKKIKVQTSQNWCPSLTKPLSSLPLNPSSALNVRALVTLPPGVRIGKKEVRERPLTSHGLMIQRKNIMKLSLLHMQLSMPILFLL